jgi:hypothetical protein
MTLGFCFDCKLPLYLLVVAQENDLICQDCFDKRLESISGREVVKCPTCGRASDYVRSCGWCGNLVCDFCIDEGDHTKGIDCYPPDESRE